MSASRIVDSARGIAERVNQMDGDPYAYESDYWDYRDPAHPDVATSLGYLATVLRRKRRWPRRGACSKPSATLPGTSGRSRF